MDPVRKKIGISHTKLSSSCADDCNPRNHDGKCNDSCIQICPNVCKTAAAAPCPPFPGSPPPPQPPRQPLILPHPANAAQKHLLTTSMIIMGSLVGTAFLFCILCAYLRARHTRQRISRSSASGSPLSFGTQDDFLDEDQGPEIIHPIWFINTIGLQQSVIDSIAVLKYKKDDGLIEDTDCSVCLNEFQEDESLRLLPKCSHAFHVTCIDTWLRSHKNCPLCRAPIACDVQVDLAVPASSDLSSREETQVENSENNSGFVSNHQVGEAETSEARGENSKMSVNLPVGNHLRMQSDLVERLQTGEAETQPMRRSVSMDSSSAMAIYNVMANFKQQGNSKLKNVSKRRSSGGLSFGKLIKSSSIGHALQKKPIPMKRSSSSGNSSASRQSRSQDSILPL